jgi:hypothetical protein
LHAVAANVFGTVGGTTKNTQSANKRIQQSVLNQRPICRLSFDRNIAVSPARINVSLILVGNEFPGILIFVKGPPQEQLTVIAQAADTMSFFFGSAQCGKQQRSEDRNDGNNHQQFDQSESSFELEYIFSGLTPYRQHGANANVSNKQIKSKYVPGLSLESEESSPLKAKQNKARFVLCAFLVSLREKGAG